MKNLIIFILLLLITGLAFAQENLPIIKSNSATVSIQDGKEKSNSWNLVPDLKPDVYEAKLIDGKPHKVTFITDIDSISFTVEEGKKYDFIIQYNNQLCYQQIVGRRFVPAAVFDKKYQNATRGKTFIEIPEVYELVNIAIAITPNAIGNPNLVLQKSDYYKKVREQFDKFQNHPLISAFEEELKKGNYNRIKMNGNAFEFDKKGRIVRSKIYDRTGFVNDRSNALLPYLDLLQKFSDESDFRKFYKENKATYQEQIAFFRDVANLAEMVKWLGKNFPKSNNYNTYKIIFSPLVAYNQSTTWFESNGFKELQPHVNFPYLLDVPKSLNLSKEAENLYRGNIVFTELNHGYINIEDEKIQARILKATENRDFWIDKKMGANYYTGLGCFYEYMNWVLVSLRYSDIAPKDEQEKMIARINRIMTNNRGFLQFEAFSNFALNLYRNRQPNQTISDLYPQIVEWFEKESKAQKN
jgi:hypothetical protein